MIVRTAVGLSRLGGRDYWVKFFGWAEFDPDPDFDSDEM
jgi:hypothetical protein